MTTASRPRLTLQRTALAVVLVGALAACASDNTETSAPRPTNIPGFGTALGVQNATYEYTIPIGSSDRLAAGEPVDILPGSLTARVGQTIKIVNEDRRGHSVGPWFVGANETVVQEFTTAGLFEGVCTVHPSGAFILEVVEG